MSSTTLVAGSLKHRFASSSSSTLPTRYSDMSQTETFPTWRTRSSQDEVQQAPQEMKFDPSVLMDDRELLRPKAVKPLIAAAPQGGDFSLHERLMRIEARLASIEASSHEVAISERKVLDMRTGRIEESLLASHLAHIDSQLSGGNERVGGLATQVCDLDEKFHEISEEDLGDDDTADNESGALEDLEQRFNLIQVQVNELRQA